MSITKHNAAAPFPPPSLMQRASGLTSAEDFEALGREIFRALELASPRPLASYATIMEFGVGCGRLARMLPDFKGDYVGVDIDVELLKWTSSHLPWVEPTLTFQLKPLMLAPGRFECAISISIFSHMNEADTQFYLAELKRITKPGAHIFLTMHGERALERLDSEPSLANMLGMTNESILEAKLALLQDGFHFVRLNSPVVSYGAEFGITFTTSKFIKTNWSQHFDVVNICHGAIHDFQDIIVLRHAD